MKKEALLKNNYRVGGYFGHPLGKRAKDESDVEFKMRQALQWSMKSCGITAPNPSVGCLVFQNDDLVVAGSTREYRREHAERVALQSFNGDPTKCDIFLTLEPCSHQGHQPPCLEVVNRFQWRQVFVSCQDPNPKVLGRGIQELKNQQKSVQIGLLKNENIAWNLPFFFQQHFQRPMIVGKWAESQDGFLADKNGDSKWISNKESREYTHWLRQKYDAILVGASTFLVDQPLLNCRLGHPHRQPVRVIWDPRDKVSPDLLKRKDFLATGQETIVVKEKKLAEVLLSSQFAELVAEKLRRPFQSIMVEGGAKSLAELARADALDLIHVFQGEKEIGSSAHTSPLKAFEDSFQWPFLVDTLIEGDRLVEVLPPDRFKKIFS